jgi:hypothetical protein
MTADQNPMRQRVKTFALRIIRVCESLPQNNMGWVMGKQLLKSGTSIGANYCEALRASSRAHFITIWKSHCEKLPKPNTGWNCLPKVRSLNPTC